MKDPRRSGQEPMRPQMRRAAVEPHGTTVDEGPPTTRAYLHSETDMAGSPASRYCSAAATSNSPPLTASCGAA